MIHLYLKIQEKYYYYYYYVTLSERISLTLSRQPSLSSIASRRSSGFHPVSAQSCDYFQNFFPADGSSLEFASLLKSSGLFSVFWLILIMLCFDLLTRPKMPFKVMHRKEVTHYERKSRGRKLADEMGRGKKIPKVPS